MNADSPLAALRAAYDRKPALREVYADLYRRMAAACVAGNVVEIGGGTGTSRGFFDDHFVTDITLTRDVDVVCDAEALPFADASADNLVMLDVLHHIPRPARFLDEATRVLRRGGRVVCVEPAITLGSSAFYRLFHPEPVSMRVDPLGDRPLSGRAAMDSNQAIPTLLATRERDRLERRFPSLRLVSVDWFSLIAYPLSGGLRPWGLLKPGRSTDYLLKLDAFLSRPLGRWFGFRVRLVLERK